MTVRVSDIIQLKIMADAVVLSGQKGLDRAVNRVASIERPFAEHEEYSYHVAKPGDIYISKLYVFDTVEKLHEELCFQHETGACGLITHKERVSILDDHTFELSNEFNLPIIAINDDVGLTELIFSITDLIIKDKAMQIQIKHFENLLQNDLSKEDLKNSIANLDWKLQDNIQCMYVSTEERVNVHHLETNSTDIILSIFDGIIFIISDKSEREIAIRINRYLEEIKRHYNSYHVGIGDINTGIDNLKHAVFEAVCANAFGEKTEKRITRYESLGSFSLLAELRDSRRLKEFCDSYIHKIKQMGNEDRFEIERLIESYVKSEGDFKSVSDQMYIHEATVRYRMNKLRTHLGYDSMTEMFSDLKALTYATWILDSESLKRFK